MDHFKKQVESEGGQFHLIPLGLQPRVGCSKFLTRFHTLRFSNCIFDILIITC